MKESNIFKINLFKGKETKKSSEINLSKIETIIVKFYLIALFIFIIAIMLSSIFGKVNFNIIFYSFCGVIILGFIIALVIMLKDIIKTMKNSNK